jgi:hypothetical protein
VSKVDGKFALTVVITPNIIVPVFSEQKQQHCLSMITILAGQIKLSYLRKIIGGNIFCIKNFILVEYGVSFLNVLQYFVHCQGSACALSGQCLCTVRAVLVHCQGCACALSELCLCTVRAVLVHCQGSAGYNLLTTLNVVVSINVRNMGTL